MRLYMWLTEHNWALKADGYRNAVLGQQELNKLMCFHAREKLKKKNPDSAYNDKALSSFPACILLVGQSSFRSGSGRRDLSVPSAHKVLAQSGTRLGGGGADNSTCLLLTNKRRARTLLLGHSKEFTPKLCGHSNT